MKVFLPQFGTSYCKICPICGDLQCQALKVIRLVGTMAVKNRGGSGDCSLEFAAYEL